MRWGGAYLLAAIDEQRRSPGRAAKATGLKPIEAIVRDLWRASIAELDRFDALVLDPPRAGAALQVERIAKCKVPVVIAVSCNAATLARDARMLIDGGYVMGPVTPVDQFLYAPHVEAVAESSAAPDRCGRREAARRRRGRPASQDRGSLPRRGWPLRTARG